MKKYLLISAMIIAALLVACDNDETAGVKEITVGQENISLSFTKEGDTVFVPVDFDGKIEVSSNQPEWCQTRRTGNGMRVLGIDVTVDPTERGEPRSAEITISGAGAEPVVVSVSQNGATPVINVVETSILIDDVLSFTLTVAANIDVAFELPEWIQEGDMPLPPATHSFIVDALPEGATLREGSMSVKGLTAAAAAPVVIPAKQKGLPTAPTLTEPQITSSAVDMMFTKDGYANFGMNEKYIISAPGSGGAPASIYNPQLKTYVASFPEENANSFYMIDYFTDATGGVMQGEFTLETYLRVTNVGKGQVIRPIASLALSGDINAWYAGLGIGIEIGEDDICVIRISREGDAWPSQLAGNFKVEADKYYHIVFTMDKTAYPRTMRCYVNGEPTGAVSWSAWWLEFPWGTQRWFGMGGNQNNDGYVTETMTGEIALFRIYDYRLSDDQAAFRYNAITARQSLTKVEDLDEMFNVTLPAKLAGSLSDIHKAAIEEAIELGGKLMANMEATDGDMEAWLDYAALLLDYK